MKIDIRSDDLSSPAVRELVATHLADTAIQHCRHDDGNHALDIAGLLGADVAFWTAWSGFQLLGCGALRHLSAEHAEVKSMHTIKGHRNQGIGRAMLCHLIGEARRRGYRQLNLETGSQDSFAPARGLYESMGFAYGDPFGDYQDHPDSVFMSRTL